ncbi:MAG: TrkH family potassium uptake protein [Caldilinea sp.]|nr:TrkH family potassium uptake protein [Caldilinea sp.]MDW8440147.1 potassium transporter TrkG [Caldilineaceae bacterium]
MTATPWSLYYGESDWPSLLWSAGAAIMTGAVLLRFTDLSEELRVREGFAVVSFAWLLFSFFGALPFWLSGAVPSFTDAMFETLSGFTTTGASILTDIEALPHGLLFWRSMTHWIGGMGIIVLSLAVLPMVGVGGMQLYKAEVAGPTADKLAPRIAQTAKILWGVYAALTFLQTTLLLLGGMSLFDALCTAFGTIASGGFSPRNASIAYYNSPYINWVTIFFMMMAGVNFALHYRFATGNLRAYWKDREFHVFIGSVTVASLLVLWNVWSAYQDKWQALEDAIFSVVSLHTSTGFALANYEAWSPGAQFVLLVVMIIGGSAGSTSGGLKVVRIYLLFKYIAALFTRLLHPQALVPTRIHGVAVSREIMGDVLGYIGVYFVAIIVGSYCLTATGVDWISSLSAVVSCLGGVGPGMEAVGPFDNYAWLSPFAKWVLMACMLLGRLEFFSLLILFSPAYWRP